ncbi:hypothetical protein ABZ608_41430 [Streptomyces sp. NPDC013172]|uniref:Uncharacterized protein n=1 Tax=Streptomyces atriruber TaxID=545121 RepID=A0ABV3C0Y4_9ACTN
MAVTWTDRVPEVERITSQAREVRFWRTVLSALAGVLFGLGWLTAKGFAVLWLAVVWTATAVRLGWQEARRGAAGTG